MVDELIKKHNMEEQELVKSCDALSDSEKTQLIHMLDRALDSTNGHLTDEKVKFIAENTENLAKVISGIYRKSAVEDKKRDAHLASVDRKLESITIKMEALSTDSKESDKKIIEKLEENNKELKELQLKSARRDGAEEIKAEIKPSSDKKKYGLPILRWISENQFFVTIIVIIIALQGGNLANFIMGLFK